MIVGIAALAAVPKVIKLTKQLEQYVSYFILFQYALHWLLYKHDTIDNFNPGALHHVRHTCDGSSGDELFEMSQIADCLTVDNICNGFPQENSKCV